MEDNKVEIKITITKKALRIIGLVTGMIVLSFLPGGVMFAAIVVSIALLLNRNKSKE